MWPTGAGGLPIAPAPEQQATGKNDERLTKGVDAKQQPGHKTYMICLMEGDACGPLAHVVCKQLQHLTFAQTTQQTTHRLKSQTLTKPVEMSTAARA
jgi:hypothetical protein